MVVFASGAGFSLYGTFTGPVRAGRVEAVFAGFAATALGRTGLRGLGAILGAVRDLGRGAIRGRALFFVFFAALSAFSGTASICRGSWGAAGAGRTFWFARLYLMAFQFRWRYISPWME
jgi:hypothetical protein